MMSVTRHVGKCGDILFTLLFDLLFRHANEIYLIHLLYCRGIVLIQCGIVFLCLIQQIRDIVIKINDFLNPPSRLSW